MTLFRSQTWWPSLKFFLLDFLQWVIFSSCRQFWPSYILFYCYVNHCGSCILPTVESPYSPTFQTSPLSSIHSESTILNPVVQIQKSESESEQTGLEAPILPSSLVGLFFLIPGCHSTQSRLLCRFPRVSTTLVTLLYPLWYLSNHCTFHFSNIS